MRLLEVFRPEDVRLAGVREAIARLGAIGFDAVKHLVLVPDRAPAARLDPDVIYPYLPRATVATTSAKAYLDLLAGAVVM